MVRMNFTHHQTLSPNNNLIVSLSLTNDHQYLAIGYDGHEVLVYHYVNNQFSPFQTLHFNSSTRRKVQLSPDHQHLLVAHGDGLVEVYEFGNHSFELGLSWGEWLSGETVRDAEMDAEQKLVGVATDQDTYILSMEGTLHELQTLNHSSHQLEFSRDGQHLLTTAEGRLSIFWNQLFQQCHLSYCLQCRNQSCVRCNELVDYFLDPLTGRCELCSIDFCAQCSNHGLGTLDPGFNENVFISGIAGQALWPARGENRGWRWAFLLGLPLGAALVGWARGGLGASCGRAR